jgi:hypothetical protein
MIANGRDDITLRSATTSPGDSAEILDQTWIGDIFERFSKDMGALLPKLGRMASAGGLASYKPRIRHLTLRIAI